MSRLALAAVLALTAVLADAYPLHGRRPVRSTRPANYYPDVYVPLPAPYLYPDEYDEDADYGQEQWFDSVAADPAANAAFLQNLMEANKYGVGLGGRYLDPRYRDSDDYVFGSVNSGVSSGTGRGGYEAQAGSPAYGRYQYRVAQERRDEDDDDADVRELHELAKKSASSSSARTDEQRLQELEAQALLAAALARQREAREEEARRAASQRAEEFAGDVNDLADLVDLDQGLERLFARSGISNMYRDRQEQRPWNGKDPVWNGYYMGALENALPPRQVRSRSSDNSRQKSSRPKTTVAPSTTTTSAKAAPSTPTPTATPRSATSTSTPSKRMLSPGQMGGQPEVALLRPAAPRAAPRPAPRAAARPHQGGVDEIRNLLRVQDTMARAPSHGHGDLLSLLPGIAKRSVPKAKHIVSDEGSLVDELSSLKRRSD